MQEAFIQTSVFQSELRNWLQVTNRSTTFNIPVTELDEDTESQSKHPWSDFGKSVLIYLSSANQTDIIRTQKLGSNSGLKYILNLSHQAKKINEKRKKECFYFILVSKIKVTNKKFCKSSKISSLNLSRFLLINLLNNFSIIIFFEGGGNKWYSIFPNFVGGCNIPLYFSVFRCQWAWKKIKIQVLGLPVYLNTHQQPSTLVSVLLQGCTVVVGEGKWAVECYYWLNSLVYGTDGQFVPFTGGDEGERGPEIRTQ